MPAIDPAIDDVTDRTVIKIPQELQAFAAAIVPERVTRLERIVIALLASPNRQWDAQAELQNGYAAAIVERAREIESEMESIERQSLLSKDRQP